MNHRVYIQLDKKGKISGQRTHLEPLFNPKSSWPAITEVYFKSFNVTGVALTKRRRLLLRPYQGTDLNCFPGCKSQCVSSGFFSNE
jgi:hypothetical protein